MVEGIPPHQRENISKAVAVLTAFFDKDNANNAFVNEVAAPYTGSPEDTALLTAGLLSVAGIVTKELAHVTGMSVEQLLQNVAKQYGEQ